MTERPGALLDTNVLSDILFDDPSWAPWSIRQVEMASLRGKLAINEIVYAELSVRAPSIEQLDEALDDADLDLLTTPRTALFIAGKAFAAYRAQGGPRNSMLPDFFIGAHAAVLGVPLLTRDARRYRTYFPTVELLTP